MGKTVKKIRTEGVSHSYSAKKPNNPILLPGYELDDWLEAEKGFSF